MEKETYNDKTKSVRIGKEIYRRLKIHVATIGVSMTEFMDENLGKVLPALPKEKKK